MEINVKIIYLKNFKKKIPMLGLDQVLLEVHKNNKIIVIKFNLLVGIN